jgi:hypothetical protein
MFAVPANILFENISSKLTTFKITSKGERTLILMVL